MKILLRKIIFYDKPLFVTAAAIVLAAVFSFIVLISVNKLEKEALELKDQLKNMQMLKKELTYINEIVSSREKKIGLTQTDGIVSVMEQILDSLEIKAKVIKPMGKKKTREYMEEDSELQIDSIDLNEIVNLFYKIENSPFPVKIKSVAIKTRFENSNIFTLNLTASLISKPR